MYFLPEGPTSLRNIGYTTVKHHPSFIVGGVFTINIISFHRSQAISLNSNMNMELSVQLIILSVPSKTWTDS